MCYMRFLAVAFPVIFPDKLVKPACYSDDSRTVSLVLIKQQFTTYYQTSVETYQNSKIDSGDSVRGGTQVPDDIAGFIPRLYIR